MSLLLCPELPWRLWIRFVPQSLLRLPCSPLTRQAIGRVPEIARVTPRQPVLDLPPAHVDPIAPDARHGAAVAVDVDPLDLDRPVAAEAVKVATQTWLCGCDRSGASTSARRTVFEESVSQA